MDTKDNGLTPMSGEEYVPLSDLSDGASWRRGLSAFLPIGFRQMYLCTLWHSQSARLALLQERGIYRRLKYSSFAMPGPGPNCLH